MLDDALRFISNLKRSRFSFAFKVIGQYIAERTMHHVSIRFVRASVYIVWRIYRDIITINI